MLFSVPNPNPNLTENMVQRTVRLGRKITFTINVTFTMPANCS